MNVFASLVLVGTGASVAYVSARDLLEDEAGRSLGAVADTIAARIDGFNQVYLAQAIQLARFPVVVDACLHGDEAALAALSPVLETMRETDPDLRALFLADAQGLVIGTSERQFVGISISQRPYWQRAILGETSLSNVFLTNAQAGGSALIAYAAPVAAAGGTPRCVVGILTRAQAFWSIVHAADGAAGEGSYAVVLDADSIRIAHGRRNDLLFHPAAAVPAERIAAMLSEQRFGRRTQALLEDVVAAPERAERARAPALHDVAPFQNVGRDGTAMAVARKLTTAPWTVFVDVPEATVYGPASALIRSVLVLAALVVGAWVLVGMIVTRHLQRPFLELMAAADALARGGTSRRVNVTTQDEIGELGARFNEMADAVESARGELETRVSARTAELEAANAELRAQREELLAQREELHAQQAELLTKNNEIEQADRMKSEFLANMSHELRTPLNAIIGFSDLLLDGALGPLAAPQSGAVEDVLHSGRHLLRLINEILDLAKIEAGELDLECTSVDPAGAIADACALLHPSASGRNVTLRQPSHVVPNVRADIARLRQILLNLGSNAVKFSPEHGVVELRVERTQGAVRFEVSDQGRGIPAELASRLFTPFVQAPAQGELLEGTGLGLAITRRLVEQHGGTIGVDSRPGEGATFWFTLPLASASPGSRTLALISDPATTRAELCREVLTARGYDTVYSPVDPIGDVQRLQPALVVLDAWREEPDGLDLLNRLVCDPSTRAIPVVLAGAPSPAGFLGMPATESMIRARVESAVSGERAGRVVLVIDDDDRAASLLRTILTGAGFVVECAPTGESGLQRARAGGIDVVLVDLVLPDISGFDVVDALHQGESTRDLPILVISASDPSLEQRGHLRHRVRALARKGDMTREEFVTAIDRALQARPPLAVSGPFVLVVDDHDLNRTLASSILERAGYCVRTAATGAEALESMRAQRPSLVLLDLQMPGVDGFAVTREVRSDPSLRRLPIVALTALAMRGDETRARAAGVDAYLTKPIDRRALLETIAQFVAPMR